MPSSAMSLERSLAHFGSQLHQPLYVLAGQQNHFSYAVILQQGTHLGVFSTQTFSFRVHLHFYKLESLMCGVLPSGYLSYMPARKVRFPFNDCWCFAFCILCMCYFKPASQISVLNLAFFLSFCSLIGDSNKSSEKIDCNPGLKCHLSVPFSYILRRVLRTGWNASPLSNRLLVLQ